MSWQAIQGQDRVLKRLRALLKTKRIPPAMLFHGPPGVGKAMAAFEFAKALNCSGDDAPGLGLGGDDSDEAGPQACGRCDSCVNADKGIDADLKRLDASYQAGLLGEDAEKQQHIKIDSIRHLIKDLEMRSWQDRWKIAILEDAHTMQTSAANALLKALEEPPPRTLWLLVTSRRELLLPTIASRCHAFAFAALPQDLVASILKTRGFDQEQAAFFARMAEGSPGRALALWERKFPDPDSWIKDPLAPLRLAEELPRELHLSRPLAEDHLHSMAWHLRLKRGIEKSGDAKTRRTIENIEALRRCLKSNADPRMVVQLAALELQRLP